MTPEGQIKAKVDAILKKYPVKVFKPVQFGMGGDMLDYHCLVRMGDTPVAFFIETKKPGKDPTSRQQNTIDELRRDYRANVFVIHDPFGYGLIMLDNWLSKVTKANGVSAGADDD